MRKTVFPLLFLGAALCSAPAGASVISGSFTNPANGNVYVLLSQNNWTGSEAEAISLGGHLATINDAAENAWVTGTFSGFGGVARALWIGLNDAASEGTFVWASGQAVAYTNWGPGEPNDSGGGEDYAHIFPTTDPRFPTWNDAPDQAVAFGFTFHGVVEIAGTVPEPGSLALWGAAIAGLGLWGRPRRAQRRALK